MFSGIHIELISAHFSLASTDVVSAAAPGVIVIRPSGQAIDESVEAGRQRSIQAHHHAYLAGRLDPATLCAPACRRPLLLQALSRFLARQFRPTRAR